MLAVSFFFCLLLAAASQPQNLQLGIIWSAPFLSSGGYCSEATEIAKALHKKVDRLKIQQHGDSFSPEYAKSLDESTKRILKQLMSISRGEICKSPFGCVCVCHSEPGAWSAPLPRYQTSNACPDPGCSYRIGRTMFETDRIPEGWSQRMMALDEIWVPTEFQREVFINGGVPAERLFVVGESIDSDFYHPGKVSALPLPSLSSSDASFSSETFIFLSVFKWEERKGWDILLKAYFEEFSRQTDDVALVLLTNAYHTDDNFDGKIKEFSRSLDNGAIDFELRPRVHVIPRRLSHAEMPRLYKKADAVVLPTRGEGWGRPHTEAMAMGLPLIATNWSGPTAFMTSENSYPLRIDGLVPIMDGPFRGHRWAEPSVSHLQELMRRVYNEKDERQSRGAQAREDMVTKFGMSKLSEQMLEVCLNIVIFLSNLTLYLFRSPLPTRFHHTFFISDFPSFRVN